MSTIFEDKLRALCIAYDNEYRTFPEHEHGGLSIFEFFIKNGIDVDAEPDNDYLQDAWGASDRWRKGEFSRVEETNDV